MIVIALVAVVMLQRSEGGALGIGGGGGFMTGRGQANALTRATAWLGGAFFLTSIVLTVLANMQRAPKSVFDQVQPQTQQGAPGQAPARRLAVRPAAAAGAGRPDARSGAGARRAAAAALSGQGKASEGRFAGPFRLRAVRCERACEQMGGTALFRSRIDSKGIGVVSHGAVRFHHRRRGFLARQRARFGGPRFTPPGPWLHGSPAKARPLSQRRSGHDEPVSARRGVRHRRRGGDRSRSRSLRALHRHVRRARPTTSPPAASTRRSSPRSAAAITSAAPCR